jgi:hypothetical protein
MHIYATANGDGLIFSGDEWIVCTYVHNIPPVVPVAEYSGLSSVSLQAGIWNVQRCALRHHTQIGARANAGFHHGSVDECW